MTRKEVGELRSEACSIDQELSRLAKGIFEEGTVVLKRFMSLRGDGKKYRDGRGVEKTSKLCVYILRKHNVATSVEARMVGGILVLRSNPATI
jgi:hypothetical protein